MGSRMEMKMEEVEDKLLITKDIFVFMYKLKLF